MDTELYNSFGGYAVRKDGEHYFSEEYDKEWGTNKTLSQIEQEAKLLPDSIWQIDLDLPLRGATWTRRKDGKWYLTDTNQSFA